MAETEAQVQQPGFIHAEEAEEEAGDSALDIPIESTASLRSSILEYYEENGRTYHSLSAGKYILPNDEGEQERLDILNHLFLLTYNGRLCICPKNDGAKRVLDMGTGTGMWAMDYADAHPEAEVVGVDLSPIQPSFVPPNCSFEIDDLEKQWTWSKRFDLIFARSLATAFASWPATMKKAFDHLEPGGYFEIHDSSINLKCDDGSIPEDCALMKWCSTMVEASQRLGRPADQIADYPGWLRDAGFVDVTVKNFKWPINRWPKDKAFKEMGAWSLTALDGGLEGLSMALCTRTLGWTQEETIAFCSQVRRDLRNRNYHGYWKIVVTYGKRPDE